MEIKNKSTTLTHQLYLLMRDEILRGDHGVHVQLPGETTLAQQYGVGRVTVRRALQQLEEEGLVERHHGSGTYVSERANPTTLRGQISDFEKQAEWLTLNTKVKLISVERQAATAAVARIMGIAPGDQVQRSLRLRSFEKRPCLLLDTFVPASVAKLYRASSLATSSMHRKLQEAGIQFATAECTVSASLADPRQAALLEVPVAAALLFMVWVIRDQERRVVQYQLLHARPDVYVLYTELGAS